jgi:hypothetical protein
MEVPLLSRPMALVDMPQYDPPAPDGSTTPVRVVEILSLRLCGSA